MNICRACDKTTTYVSVENGRIEPVMQIAVVATKPFKEKKRREIHTHTQNGM